MVPADEFVQLPGDPLLGLVLAFLPPARRLRLGERRLRGQPVPIAAWAPAEHGAPPSRDAATISAARTSPGLRAARAAGRAARGGAGEQSEHREATVPGGRRRLRGADRTYGPTGSRPARRRATARKPFGIILGTSGRNRFLCGASQAGQGLMATPSNMYPNGRG